MPDRAVSQLTPGPQDPGLKRRFLSVNQDRLRRAHENLTPRQQDFLDLLPLLFHINHPLLPGYIAHDTPAGILDYTPSHRSTLAAKRRSRFFSHDKSILRHPVIRGIYLTGSPGTIAYSKASDLDVWICHVSDLSRKQIDAIQRKADHLEHFAASLGLETHFFIFDPDRFRVGETMSLSDESSGTSQHLLLLDEFYRSGLVVAGLTPLWWRVPPDQEQRYDDWVTEVTEKRIINTANYVDFGGLAHIPAEEFFGAAVWQLYKSITSPYKSVMKLLLMEVYAVEYPTSALLSHRYKSLVAGNNVNLDDLDPYVLMYSKVEEYLKQNSDPTRLNVLRRCFYLKATERSGSKPTPRQSGWREEILDRLVRSWGWNTADTRRLDQRQDWKIETALEERRDLTKVLQQCYATLSDFARRHTTDKNISQSDLNILGHKLYAAFEKKPGKIDIVTRGICIDPVESDLSLHQSTTGKDEYTWALYKGSVVPDASAGQAALKRTRSIVEILAWCHFNGMVSHSTNWRIYTETGPSLLEIRKTLAAIEKYFPADHNEEEEDNSRFNERPQLKRALLLVNTGTNPLADHGKNGVVLMSTRTDAFQFGGRRINLIKTADLIIVTSWEEVFTFHYAGPRGLMDALLEYLQWSPRQDNSQPPALPVACFSNDYAKSISLRVASFFRTAVQFLGDHSTHDSAHYIIQIEDSFYRIYSGHQKSYCDEHPTYGALLKVLAQPCPGFTQVRFDEGCRKAGVLPAIYRTNTPSKIQVYAQQQGGKADVYILDAYGALFVQRRALFGLPILFEQYRCFIESTSKQFAYSQSEDRGESDCPDIEFYEIKTNDTGEPIVRRHRLELRQTAGYLSVRVFADIDSNGHPQFTIFCNDREFSTLEHGGRLFTVVAQFVQSQRQSPEPYPVYITELQASTRFRKSHGIEHHQIIHLLNYKKRIEYQLTQALRTQAATPAINAIAS